MTAQVWKVEGYVDVGPISVEHREKAHTTFRAVDWKHALSMAPKQLALMGDHLNEPDITSVHRLEPKP